MRPEELYVIYNKITLEILFIYPEEFFAKRKLDKLIESNVTGTTPNHEKLQIMTLKAALATIHLDYNDQLLLSERGY